MVLFKAMKSARYENTESSRHLLTTYRRYQHLRAQKQINQHDMGTPLLPLRLLTTVGSQDTNTLYNKHTCNYIFPY
jgi:hypothetical protein